MYPFQNHYRCNQRVNAPFSEPYMGERDYGGQPYSTDIVCAANQNTAFRTALWTGCNLQVTLMCIPMNGDIGLEMHNDTDQMIRVEDGQGSYLMGYCQGKMEFQGKLCKGDAVFVPAGMWHNICNEGNCALKISSVYAPPKHPKGTVHQTKEDAERAEMHCN